MKLIKVSAICLFVIVICTTSIYAQHKHSSKIAAPIIHHEIDGFIGTTHVPEGGNRDSDATLILPNLGLNYKYWINEKFAVGWYNNLVTQTFVINSDTHQDREMKYPFLTTIVGVYRPWKSLSFFAGPGMAIDGNGTLFDIRFGVDYGFSLSNDWFLSPRFIFDYLGGDIEAYTLGVSIGKRF